MLIIDIGILIFIIRLGIAHTSTDKSFFMNCREPVEIITLPKAVLLLTKSYKEYFSSAFAFQKSGKKEKFRSVYVPYKDILIQNLASTVKYCFSNFDTMTKM